MGSCQSWPLSDYFTSGSSYAIQPSERLHEAQLFARDYSLSASRSLSFLTILADVPGVVFVTYNEDPVDPTAFATVKVSGNSKAVVDYITVDSPDEETLHLSTAVNGYTPTKDDVVLVEIYMHHKNSLLRVEQHGSGDVVVLEDVVLSVTDEVYAGAYFGVADNSTGNIFVCDPKGVARTNGFEISTVRGSGIVQIELTSVNTKDVTVPVSVLYGQKAQQVRLFINELDAVDARFWTERVPASTSMCLSSHKTVRLRTAIRYGEFTDASEIVRGPPLPRLPLPKRAPSTIVKASREPTK